MIHFSIQVKFQVLFPANSALVPIFALNLHSPYPRTVLILKTLEIVIVFSYLALDQLYEHVYVGHSCEVTFEQIVVSSAGN